MTQWRRLAAATALASFVWAVLGVPVVDATLFHVGSEHANAQHVEAADGPACHAERCTLAAPGAPVASARGLVALPRTELVARRGAPLHPDNTHLDRLPSHAPGSRAPPA